ncbi:hypothetical protein [Ileibacterium valens]|uniref:hypothetical protein n=1 Tax=Ileibacterium valens TaxID=1862668 RepID=UPI00272FE8C8|nr:hypothetical protein [Ileibacterium valens]
MAVKKTYDKHAVAFPTKVLAAEGGEHVLNVVMDKDRDNGEIVEIVDYNELDSYTIQDTTAAEGIVRYLPDNGNVYVEIASTAEVVFIYSVPSNPYATTRADRDEHYFYNAKGDMARGYVLHKRDIIEESIENFTGFTGMPAVGDAVVSAGGKWNKKA